MTNLETIRRARKLGQQDLADAAGVPQTTISRIECGKGATLRSALRIARSLSLSVEEVFGDVVLDEQDDANDTLRDDPADASPLRPSTPVAVG